MVGGPDPTLARDETNSFYIVLLTQNVHCLIYYQSMNILIRIHIKCLQLMGAMLIRPVKYESAHSYRATGRLFRLCIRHGMKPINKYSKISL
jgi:hypothetical protein